jgi:A/G-specific adenine glycosylase
VPPSPTITEGIPRVPQRRALLAALLRWHRKHGRNLPWRGEHDPYRVWLREIMLQQTTVAAVIPYLRRFLERFPTVQTLAAADEADVLRLWEGLGYYSRARNLHRAARAIVEQHAGRFPRNVATLQSLPGIGRYTAGAIASFAFDEPAPIIEANTLRLHARLLAYDGDPRSVVGQRLLWAWAEKLVNRSTEAHGLHPVGFRACDINQALMDLGATICTPTAPRCPECPLQRWCRAFQTARQHELPRLARRPAITRVTEATVAVRQRGRYLLRRRPSGERWAGLWDFPRFAVTDHAAVETVLLDGVRDQAGLTIELGSQIAQFEHGVTRYRITLHCFTAKVAEGTVSADDQLAWVNPQDFARYPLSVTGRKLATLLVESRSRQR